MAVALLSVAVSRSPVFEVRHLQVRGARHLSAARVARIAGVDGKANVLWMSTAEVERRLERHPWIAEARVSRTLPATVAIRVRERQAVAVLVPQGLLVAGDGMVLGRAPPGTLLPVVGGVAGARVGARVRDPAPQLRAAEAIPAGLRWRVERVGVRSDGELAVLTRDGVLVRLGDGADLEAKWAALEAVLRWAGRNGVRARYVDVRAPSAPALRPAG